MKVRWRILASSAPHVLRRKPRMQDTRIPVELVLVELASGLSAEQAMYEIPWITAEQIDACLPHSRAGVDPT